MATVTDATERLRSDDVDVTLIKGGTGSADQDLKKLQKTAASLFVDLIIFSYISPISLHGSWDSEINVTHLDPELSTRRLSPEAPGRHGFRGLIELTGLVPGHPGDHRHRPPHLPGAGSSSHTL